MLDKHSNLLDDNTKVRNAGKQWIYVRILHAYILVDNPSSNNNILYTKSH